MTGHRKIFLLVTLLLIVAAAAVPSGAQAGSLLSGYGAPGGGSQVLLGSALLNGGSRGDGGSGGGEGSPVSGAGLAVASGQAAGRVAGDAGASARPGGAGGGGAHETGATPGTSTKAPPTYTYPRYPRSASELTSVADSGPLGFTGTDLLLMVLVLGVLAGTADLTRRLARTLHH